jgi:hypothetical protein
VAGDDAEAKAAVLALPGVGWPIDAGGSRSRVRSGMAWLNISLNIQNGWVWQDAWKQSAHGRGCLTARPAAAG